ncbi:MAG: CsbD family protein [Desulfomicrobium sp.]|nr:CsbD family protein [Desulfomicrobium sp.]
MKSSTKNKTEGVYHEGKGKIKETVGKITNNPSLEAEGRAEKIGGKVQKKVGEVEKVLEK